jgi:hypothetical protein
VAQLQKTLPLRWPFEVPWLPVGGRLLQKDGRLKGFGYARSSEGRWWRRCAMEEGIEPSLPSFKGGREGAVSEASPLMRRFENARYSTHYARSPRRFALPTARAPHAHDLCIFTWSFDRTLTRAIGGPSSFWGPPALRSLKRVRSWARLPGATVGVLDTGVSRSTCSWASSMAQLRPRGKTTTEAIGEDPHEEAPHEENDDQNC